MWPSNFLPNWDSRLAKSLGALGLGAERSKKYAPAPSGAQVAALMEMAARSCVTVEWPPMPVLAKATTNPKASFRRAIHTPEHPRTIQRRMSELKGESVAGHSLPSAVG